MLPAQRTSPRLIGIALLAVRSAASPEATPPALPALDHTADESLDFRLDRPGPDRAPPDTQDALAYRSAGEYALRDSVSLEFGRSGFGDRSSPLGSAAISPSTLAPDGAARARAIDLYDASIRWDALRLDPVTVSLHSGLRAMAYEARFDSAASVRERAGMSAAPVVGMGARWAVLDAVSIAGQGSWRVPGEAGEGRYIGLGAELAFDLSALSRFSVGFERLRADLSDGVIAARLERDMVFARFWFRF